MIKYLMFFWLAWTSVFAQFYRDQRPTTTRPVETWSYTYYAVGYSQETRTPLWSAMETRQVAEPTTGCTRVSTFATEPRANPKITHADYAHTGYDRGHMTPNAIVAYAYGCQANGTTFITSNLVPQLHQHNAGVWASLEAAVGGVDGRNGFRKGLAERASQVWVYTGPVFWGAHIEKAGPKDIWVPTHLWKTVLWKDAKGRVKTCSWLIPHVEGIPKDAYMQYTTSIRDIAEKSGVNILGTTEDPLLDAQDADAFTALVQGD